MKTSVPVSLLLRAALVYIVVQTASCAESAEEPRNADALLREPGTIAESTIAQARIQNLHERFRWPDGGASLLSPAKAVVFESLEGGRIKPRFTHAARMERYAEIELPANARLPVHIEDSASSIGISFVIHGARDVQATLAENIALYEGAGEQGESLFFRVHEQGVEDFAFFEDKPDHETLRYDVELHGVAGLRLSSNTLELLDEHGAPRLRAVAPYVLEAAPLPSKPRWHAARLSLVGCAADTRSAPPWGRPVTPPCATSPCQCEIQVSWEGMGVKYPAMVDPEWTTTASMNKPRVWATATSLPNGRVIVIGGQSASVALKTSEIFDPNDGGTWAVGPEMMAARTHHTATTLDDGTIALVGGQDVFSPRLIELLDPATPNMNWAFEQRCELFHYRSHHATALLSNHRLLVVGGKDADSSTHIDAELCDLGGLNQCSPHALLKYARHGHTATTLRNDVVLVVGGLGPKNETSQTAEWVHPTMSKWNEATPPHVAHPYPQATLLLDGRLLVTGSSSEIFSWPDGDEFPNGPNDPWRVEAQSQIIRQSHQVTRLPNGNVLLIGGYSTIEQMDELFDPLVNSWSTFNPLLEPRKGHVAAVAGDYVVVAGGTNGSSVLASAEVLRLRPNGADCAVNAQCKSGYCVERQCCNTTCSGNCFACTSLETGLDADGECAPRLSNECGGYTCNAAGDCRTSCTVDDDCAKLFICEAQECVQAPAICDQGMLWDRRGELLDDCGLYTCEESAPGKCRESCSHGSHCNDGFRCVSGECIQNIEPPVVDERSCRCHVVGARENRPMTPGVWMLFVLGYAARRLLRAKNRWTLVF